LNSVSKREQSGSGDDEFDGSTHLPFERVKPYYEWTQFDREYVGFMRTPFAEKYFPREVACSSIELGKSGDGRSIGLVFRGSRNGWESAWQLHSSGNSFYRDI
jgi:hypothetical protein